MIKIQLQTIRFLGLVALGLVLFCPAFAQNKTAPKLSKIDSLKALISQRDNQEVQNPDVGYLGVKQQPSIGTVTTIADSRYKELTSQSIGALLQGQAPGVHVVNTSGAPGAGALVNIRGVSTINSGTTPLYVIDGIPVRAIRNPSPLALNADNDPLADINPHDIASISILKDAYSTAPYGVRGGNGVVIINTYGGTSGKTLLDITLNSGLSWAPKTLPVFNADQYRSYIVDEETSRGQTAAQIKTGMGRYLLLSTPANQLWRYNNNTDWQQQVLQNGNLNDLHMVLRGGDAVAKYSLIAGYTNQKGVIATTNFDRFSVRFNLDYKVGRKLTFINSLAFIRTDKTLKDEGNVKASNPLLLATLKSPTLTSLQQDNFGNVLRDPDSSDYAGRNNPYAVINKMRNENNTNRIFGRITGQYTFSPNLNLRIGIAADFDRLNEIRFVPSAGFAPITYVNRYSAQANSTELMVLNENTLNYENKSKSGDHVVSAYLGNSFQSTSLDSKYIKAINSTADQFLINTNDPNFIDSISSSQPTWKLVSFFTGVQYSYKSKYTIGANIRADGSSRFAQGHQWGYFPSVAGSWRVSKENFFNLNPVLSDLSLRASYGITGNDDVGYYNGYNSFVAAEYQGYSAVKLGFLGNANFTWEETKQFDGGIDIGLFKSTVELTANYYSRVTNNLLNSINLPGISGFKSYSVSEGSIRNRGLELGLAIKAKKGDFAWNSGFNITFNNNTIVSLPDRINPVVNYPGGFSSVLQVGSPIGAFYGYNTLGVYSKTADVNVKNGATNAAPFKGGDIIFEDVDKNGIIDTNDRKIIGNTNPKFFGGFHNTFSYKMFDLTVFMDFAYGNQVYNAQRAALESMSNYDNQSTTILNRWRQDGDIATMPRLQYGDPEGNNRFSSRWIEDGSYVRFKSVTFGYNMPLKSKKLGSVFKSVRIQVTGQNLYTFTKYKGYGPEVGSAVNQIMYGADYASLPQYKTVYLGVKLGL
ncbi:SusC/RagA family TonB-linked outer membrane protein [Mucilaginibacter sp. HMF5004]|uniref:SusC/RagA family TonB-linked outer membrane protein n=1 Tax=Mucilaginibacter rivuli TaxID=2857527 RepID=UPI001C5D1072|nr:SusC/RagA family TonB-linked outer membrane protein [Mucilaginibacter rivuli]MBW4888512.1 SusC/RagA family TonB-linked outer membrane protein [Mucilaginibacter rivuli]